MTTLSIAVVIPARNAENFICEALDSIAAQSRHPEQIIIVDDGSSDRTAALVEEWRHKHPTMLQLLQQKHQGVSAARNTGIRHASTDLIAFLDADDVLLPKHLQCLECAFQNHPNLVLCFADALQFNTGGIVKPSILAGSQINTVEYEEQPDDLRLMRTSAYVSLLRGSYIPSSTILCPKKALEHIGLFDETLHFAEDRDLWLRLSRVGPFAYYPFILARKRIHEHNLMHQRHLTTFQLSRFKVLQKMLAHASGLALSPEEFRQTRAARNQQVQDVLETASRHGLGSYVRVLAYLTSQRLFPSKGNLKRSLRALLYSYRKAFAKVPPG